VHDHEVVAEGAGREGVEDAVAGRDVDLGLATLLNPRRPAASCFIASISGNWWAVARTELPRLEARVSCRARTNSGPSTNAASSSEPTASRSGVEAMTSRWTGVGASSTIAPPTRTTAISTFRTTRNT